jgi:hypothetical protein
MSSSTSLWAACELPAALGQSLAACPFSRQAKHVVVSNFSLIRFTLRSSLRSTGNMEILRRTRYRREWLLTWTVSPRTSIRPWSLQLLLLLFWFAGTGSVRSRASSVTLVAIACLCLGHSKWTFAFLRPMSFPVLPFLR